MEYSAYILEIQEIEGKNIVKKYLSEVIEKCKELDLYCVIEIMNEENSKKDMMVGGSSTFPYSLFESAADNITKLKEDNQRERKSLFDGLFGFFKKEKEKDETTDVNVIEPLKIITPKQIDISVLDNLKNITEIVRVKIEIEEKIEQINQIQGLYELENRLQSY